MTDAPLTTENELQHRIKTPAGGHTLADEPYNRRWVERVKARCVVSESGCWLWQGPRMYNGYGHNTYRSKHAIVHRKMFEISSGSPLDRWEYACHSCDTKLCCNPAHLWKGTPLDNQVDSVMKRRNGEQKVTHCPRGHAYVEGNINWKVAASGRPARECKECHRIKTRRRYWQKRGLSRDAAMAKAMERYA